MNIKKELLSSLAVISIFSFLAISVLATPLDTLTTHAAVEGRSMVKTGCRWMRTKDAVMTFWIYEPSGTVEGHDEAGWAITLTVGDTLYVWTVTKIRTCGKSTIIIIKADPHPLPGVDNAMPGPSSITVILNHNAARLLVVAHGRRVFFIGNTLA